MMSVEWYSPASFRFSVRYASPFNASRGLSRHISDCAQSSTPLPGVSSAHSPSRNVLSTDSAGLFVSPTRRDVAFRNPRNSRCRPSYTGSRYVYSVTSFVGGPKMLMPSMTVSFLTTCETRGITRGQGLPAALAAIISELELLYSRSDDLPSPL